MESVQKPYETFGTVSRGQKQPSICGKEKAAASILALVHNRYFATSNPVVTKILLTL